MSIKENEKKKQKEQLIKNINRQLTPKENEDGTKSFGELKEFDISKINLDSIIFIVGK